MAKEPRETELKFRIPSGEAYQKLRDSLAQKSGPPLVQDQENHFFDGKDREMLAKRMTLRLRKVVSPTRTYFLFAMKGDADVSAGLSSTYEDEEEVSPEFAVQLLRDPAHFLESSEHRIVESARREFPCPSGYTTMGGYGTTRLKFPLSCEGHKIVAELDETRYPTFGQTAYELEVELSEIAVEGGLTIGKLREFVVGLLEEAGVPVVFSKRNKLRNLLAGSIE